MIIASSPGKAILFGEHAVVYGKLGIVASINKRAYVEVSDGNSIKLYDYKNPDKNVLRPIKLIINKITKNPKINIKIKSKIPKKAGLGSSSAVFTALTAALSKYCNKNLSKKEIEKIACLGDKIAHGKPSGIDTNIATYGGFGIFTKKQGFKKLRIKKNLPVVIGNTGIKSPTRSMVLKVKKGIKKNMIFINEMHNISKSAIKAIKNYDLSLIGELMNENQEYLRKIGVSHPRIEKLIQIALKNSALGAKLTGGGGGGCIIALAEDEKSQTKIKKSIKNSFIAKLGVEGIRFE